MSRRGTRRPGVATSTLAEIRAALSAGASPGHALAVAQDDPLGPVAREVRLGRSVADAACAVDTGDAGADLLVRALAVAEHAGAGGVAAVGQTLAAVREAARLERLVRVRTAQARGTATLLCVVPVVAWLLLVGMDRGAVGFYATPLGATTGFVAGGLGLGGRWWSRRLVARVGHATAAADPLMPARLPADRGRAAAAGVPVGIGLALAFSPLAGIVAGGLVAFACGRPPARRGGRDRPVHTAGGAAETVELVAIALAAGLPTMAAVAAVAPVAPPPARSVMGDAARRLRSGWDAQTAFAGTGLEALGAVLATADRWGAPAAESLHALADDLRVARRTAVEEAAERLELSLVFPTTLLMLPAFVLGVVPPLLWTAFAG